MAQLMSHTAGFGVSAVYNDAGLGATDLQGMIDKLARSCRWKPSRARRGTTAPASTSRAI
jgi:hypothetical protein